MVATNAIQVRHLPGQAIAYQRYHGTIASIESVTSAVRSWVVTMGYDPEGPLAIEVYGEPSADTAEEYDIEVQLPVGRDARAAPDDQVQIKRFEPVEAVVMTLHGPSDLARMREPLERMHAWLRERNGRSTTVVRWVEVTDPAKVSPDEQVTELQLIVERGSLSRGPESAPPLDASPQEQPTVGVTASTTRPAGAPEDTEATDRTAARAVAEPVTDRPEPHAVTPPAAEAMRREEPLVTPPPETRHITASLSEDAAPHRYGAYGEEERGGGIGRLVMGAAGVVVIALSVAGIILFRRRK